MVDCRSVVRSWSVRRAVRCWRRWRGGVGGGGRRRRRVRSGGVWRLISFTSDTVDAALVVAGPEVLVESRPVAAVEGVLLSVLVTEMIDLRVNAVLKAPCLD